MALPERISTETELEDALAEPSQADLDCIARIDGDILVLGAGGKMGPSLSRRAHRAAAATGSRCRVVAASRFSSSGIRAGLEAEGIRTLACDLLDPAAIDRLPLCPNVLFLAGRKFGTLDRTDLT
ncbi:MAG: epimerase, partial [Vicinamibacterales bacterium]